MTNLQQRFFLWLLLGISWKLSSGEPTGSYQPPLLLPAVPLPVASAQHNSYQPPIARARSVEYRSPLEAPPQTYSVVYTPPETLRSGGVAFQSNALPTSFHEPAGRPDHAKSLPTSYQQQPSAGSIATSYSVHQQPASVERTSYVQGSAPSQQTIHKSPASEIRSEKSPLAADRDANKQKEEYVVYYYYYYDNDTASGNNANNNLSLSFDDIPSLEGYDQDVAKQAEPEKNVNALSPAERKLDATPLSSQGRSVSSSVDRSPPADAFAQPLRPVPNVFRYGSNEVPRFPVLPNFVVSQTTPAPETPPPPTADGPPTTQPTFNGVDLDNELNNHVLDPRPEETSTHSSTTTSAPETTTTTTEEITTTEATTTTERPRRRPPGGGGRRRFNSSPSPRTRSSTTTSTTAPSSSSTTRATPSGRFQGNRVRSRPSPGGFGRSRTASRLAEEDGSSALDSSPSTQAPPSSSSTTAASTSRSRFTSQSPRRFQSSRSRSQSASSSTTSTTTTTTRAPPRARTTSRPRPNIISNRSRPPRPGFLRPRNPEPETTTAEPETTDALEESLAETPAREDQDESEAEEESEEEESETEAPPTTTEANRFSALFKPRNRANRPRSPLLGNRPPRV